MKKPPYALLMFTVFFLFSACQVSGRPPAASTAVVLPSTPLPSAVPATPTKIPSPTPTATPEPVYLEVHVWDEEPRVPVLLWHQFAANHAKRSTYMKTRLEDFALQLDALNQAGFTLINLEDWLSGNVDVSPGRRPLAITLDDLFFNNQIRLDENGVPRRDTGLGIAWYYAQEHPEFGFHYTLFANLGDKYYGDGDAAGHWQDELGRTIAWCQENGAPVYNHTYMHVVLSEMDGPEITWQLTMNDLYLRELLTQVGREDLIPSLGNMFAVPFGKWPGTGGTEVIKRYQTPEGKPMQAIFDVDFVIRAKYMSSPYASDFDPYRIPRINADPDAIEYLVAHAPEFPKMQTCSLGPFPAAAVPSDAGLLTEAIHAAIISGSCPPGLYVFNGWTFDARGDIVNVLRAP